MHKRDTYKLDEPTLAEVRAFVEATRDLPDDATVRSAIDITRGGWFDQAGGFVGSLTVEYNPTPERADP